MENIIIVEEKEKYVFENIEEVVKQFLGNFQKHIYILVKTVYLIQLIVQTKLEYIHHVCYQQ